MLAVVATTIVIGLAGFTQAVAGFGFALLVAPVLAVTVGPRSAVVLVSALGTIVPVVMTWGLRHHLDRRLTAVLLSTMLLGLPVGLVAFTRLPTNGLKLLIASTVFASVALIWKGPRRVTPHPWLDPAAGFLSGALATSTGTNGPPLVLALQSRHLTPDAFRATLSATLAVTNISVLCVFAASGHIHADRLTLAAVSVPPLLIGSWVGEGSAGASPRERSDGSCWGCCSSAPP